MRAQIVTVSEVQVVYDAQVVSRKEPREELLDVVWVIRFSFLTLPVQTIIVYAVVWIHTVAGVEESRHSFIPNCQVSVSIKITI